MAPPPRPRRWGETGDLAEPAKDLLQLVARRQDSPPRFVEVSYELRISTDETSQRVDLVKLNLRKFGTVHNTVAASCDVNASAVAVPPAPPAP